MNFRVKTGELLLVQGGNGQGKASLLAPSQPGLSRTETGEVRWRGNPIQRQPRLTTPKWSTWATPMREGRSESRG